MATKESGVVAISGDRSAMERRTFSEKVEMAKVLRGRVIVYVMTPEQALMAEEAGACAVVALGRAPADIHAQGGVPRMCDPDHIKKIKRAVRIPVIAQVRIGHSAEAQILQAIGVDFVDESELLTPADDTNNINKTKFQVPFICGSRNLGEALRRIREGAAMVRTTGETFTGDIVHTVRHLREVERDIRQLCTMDVDELSAHAQNLGASYDLLLQTRQQGRLPVVHFAAGGVATPADAALLMQLGCDGIFVGPEFFEKDDPAKHLRAIVSAVNNYRDPYVLADLSVGAGDIGGYAGI